ncbi:MAG: hypothetical protein IPL65_06405 [Lewinellaceae bacterium]|nr:hypothetical protein [Lewinellaceae bacterium]
MKKTFFAFTTLLMLSLVWVACQKESLNTADQATAEDIVSYNDLSEQTDFDIDMLVDDNAVGAADDRGDCPSVTFAQPKGAWPNTITLSYPTDGCTHDGHTFKGVIVVEQSDKMSVVGATRNVSFQDFYIDNVKIEGTRILTNTGLDANGYPSWSKQANEVFLFPDGTQASFNAEHVRTLVEGADTPTRIDNVWSVTGNSSGVNRMGNAYTANITTPLVKRAICPWVVSGVITFTNGDKTRSLDFGDGTCDRDAILTLNDGTTKTIKIRHHWWK